MRALFALICLALFVAGLYIMSLAFSYPAHEGYIFAGGLLLCVVAFFVPMAQKTD